MNKECITCNKVFYKKPDYSYSYWETRKFCSVKCSGLSRTGENSPVWKGGISSATIICSGCNKDFTGYKSKGKFGDKYCSQKCAKSTIKIVAWNKGKKTGTSKRKGVPLTNNMGDKHWNWKGGITTKNRLDRVSFQRLVQPKIFERDNYTCQMCQQRGGRLQVDHIQKWADYPELRFKEENCRTLCMACHYYITFKRKIPSGIVWGHNFNRSY